MHKDPQRETGKRPVGRPRKTDKKVYVKKGTVSTGRPKSYSEEIANYICEQLMYGRSLTSICREPKMPSMPTIYSWLRRTSKNFNEDFFNSYLMSRKFQADTLADQVIDIADDGSNDTYVKINTETGEAETIVNYDNIQRSRLRIKARQWAAAHLLPRKYAARMQLAGKDDQALVWETTSL